MPPARGHGANVSGSARTRRKRAHATVHGEEGGAERWLVTYADMLTLLLVLFIVLFSVSVVNTSKFITLKTSLAAVFGDGRPGIMSGGNGLNDNDAAGTGQQLVMPGMPVAPRAGRNQSVSSASTGASSTKTDPELQQMYRAAAAAREKSDFRSIRKRVTAALRKAGLANAARFAVDRRGLVITVVTDALVFPGNSADLLPRGRHILGIVAPSLAQETRSIEVDGHTNQQPVSTNPYPSGWELSSARASAVVRYLAAHGVTPRRLSAAGYSDQRPLYPASDPRSVTLNRRVEIVVLTTQPSTSTSD